MDLSVSDSELIKLNPQVWGIPPERLYRGWAGRKTHPSHGDPGSVESTVRIREIRLAEAETSGSGGLGSAEGTVGSG